MTGKMCSVFERSLHPKTFELRKKVLFNTFIQFNIMDIYRDYLAVYKLLTYKFKMFFFRKLSL